MGLKRGILDGFFLEWVIVLLMSGIGILHMVPGRKKKFRFRKHALSGSCLRMRWRRRKRKRRRNRHITSITHSTMHLVAVEATRVGGRRYPHRPWRWKLGIGPGGRFRRHVSLQPCLRGLWIPRVQRGTLTGGFEPEMPGISACGFQATDLFAEGFEGKAIGCTPVGAEDVSTNARGEGAMHGFAPDDSMAAAPAMSATHCKQYRVTADNAVLTEKDKGQIICHEYGPNKVTGESSPCGQTFPRGGGDEGLLSDLRSMLTKHQSKPDTPKGQCKSQGKGKVAPANKQATNTQTNSYWTP